MSRPCGKFAFCIDNYNDHPELRKLTYIEKTLADAIVRECARAKIVDGSVPASMVWSILNQTGKSHPVVYRYRRHLVASGVLVPQPGGDYFSPIAERICRTVYKNTLQQAGAERFMKESTKESFVRENSLKAAETADIGKKDLPRPVPDLEKKASSEKLKADEHLAGHDTHPQPRPKPTRSLEDLVAMSDEDLAVLDARDIAPVSVSVHVSAAARESLATRQVGPGPQQDDFNIADAFLSLGKTLGMRMQSTAEMSALPSVDLDALDTEAMVEENRQAQKATPLALGARASRGSIGRKKGASRIDQARPEPKRLDATLPPTASVPPTGNKLDVGIIQTELSKLTDADPSYRYGAKEVNALRKLYLTHAQLVDAVQSSLARRRKGGLRQGVGAYMYGAASRLSRGLKPQRGVY